MPLTTWRKSSFSDQAGSDCVEVAFAVTGVAVRDSKNTTGPVLGLPVDAWHGLLAGGGVRDRPLTQFR
jgi:hypothetical protein